METLKDWFKREVSLETMETTTLEDPTMVMLNRIKVKYIGDKAENIDDSRKLPTLIKQHNKLVRLRRADAFNSEDTFKDILEVSETGAKAYVSLYKDTLPDTMGMPSARHAAPMPSIAPTN